jgi:hypothetical protein
MKNKKDKSTKGARSEMRKEHFKSGGSTAEWRGLHTVHKHKNDKRLGNRSQQKKKIISEE